MLEIKQTSPMKHLQYNQLVVGTVAQPLTVSKEPVSRGILIVVAQDAYTVGAYVGDKLVKTTTGFFVPRGGQLEVPCDDASQIYVVADADNQSIAWIAI